MSNAFQVSPMALPRPWIRGFKLLNLIIIIITIIINLNCASSHNPSPISAAAPSQPISGLRQSSVTSPSPFAQLLKVTSSSTTPLLADSLFLLFGNLFEHDINNVFSVSYSISWLHICQNFICLCSMF